MQGCKLVLIGPSGSGKSALVNRILNNKFDAFTDSTIGFIFDRWRIDSKNIYVDIWDTAGQERFMAITPMYYRGADILVFVFDSSDVMSIGKMAKFVKQVYETKNGDNKKIIIVGNKMDLLEDVTSEYRKLRDYMKGDEDLIFYELDLLQPILLSAKTGDNVDVLKNEIIEYTEYLVSIREPMPNYNILQEKVTENTCRC